LIADSFASEPEFTKKTTSRSPGASPAIIEAASIEAGCDADQLVANDSVRSCRSAAAAMSSRPWPMFTQNSPASPSMYLAPASSHR